MNIGIPNEVASEERRVALTPVGVHALTNAGHTVFVEQSAGESCGFSDQEYRQVGAQLVYSHEEVLQRADLVVKVQPPIEDEAQQLESEKFIFSFLNLGITRKPTIDVMLDQKVGALAYEFGEQPDGTLPILTAMSEIAGQILPQIAGRLLESEPGGRGITLPGVAGIAPANVVILGAGAVGFNAARAFSALGAQVLVLDKDVNRLRHVDTALNKRVSTSIVTPLLVQRAVKFADVLIGAVFLHRQRTPHLVSTEMVKEMKTGSVIIDVSIDQGGCIETSSPTTLSSPTYIQHGVIHYCVPNITAVVARTASHALNNSVLPWVLEVARLGVTPALSRYRCLRNGTYLYNGKSTSESLSSLLDLEHLNLDAYLDIKK